MYRRAPFPYTREGFLTELVELIVHVKKKETPLRKQKKTHPKQGGQENMVSNNENDRLDVRDIEKDETQISILRTSNFSPHPVLDGVGVREKVGVLQLVLV